MNNKCNNNHDDTQTMIRESMHDHDDDRKSLGAPTINDHLLHLLIFTFTL